MALSDTEGMRLALDAFRADFLRLREEVGKVIVGQPSIVDDTLMALIAGGHVLLEGVPGLGKTLLVRTLADALHLKFSAHSVHARSDAGRHHRHQHRRRGRRDGGKRFQFQPGPIFAQLVLADEINRATPKTQSALLEAMQEHSVTVGGRRPTSSSEPFFVLATQNPLEMEGTYPLPEAQLDRFFFKLLVKYPESGGDGNDPRSHDRKLQAAGRPACSPASGSSRCRRWCGRFRSPAKSAVTELRW